MMLTILVEVIMSVFIANFKSAEHPIINVIVRGFLIMITVFVMGFLSTMFNDKEFLVGFALMISFALGLIGTICLFLIEIFFNYIDRKK